MKTSVTQVFNTYEAFQNREDKSINGVSLEFAERHPNWEEMNLTNAGCWNCINCNHCTNCDNCDNCNDCTRCDDCKNSNSCYDCYDCENCTWCEDCRVCADCTGCNNCYCCNESKNLSFVVRGEKFTLPKIPNIHQKVYEAASQENALNMDIWHTCETTHCRAGWVVFLAGKEGEELERKTNTPFAASAIYRGNSKIKVPWGAFFVSNEEALEDMKRCAEEEAKSEN